MVSVGHARRRLESLLNMNFNITSRKGREFAQKIGLAVGSFMLGWILTFVGFVPNVAQTPRSLLGIKIVFSLLPGAIGLLSGLAIIFYRLDDRTVKTMELELAAAKETPAPA